MKSVRRVALAGLSIGLLICSIGVAEPDETKPDPPLAATVNGTAITEAALTDYVNKTYRSQALDEMIQDVVVGQEAKRLGIEVNRKQVEACLDLEIFRRYRQRLRETREVYAGHPNLLTLRLEQVKADMARTRKQALLEIDNLERFALVDRITLYDKRVGEWITIQQILLGTREAAERVLALLNDGADFGRLAERETLELELRPWRGRLPAFHPGDAAAGVGWIRLPSLEAAALSIKEGDFSGILETKNGFYIIKKLVHTKRRDVPYAKLKDEIDQMLTRRNAPLKERSRTLLRIRKTAKIERQDGS